MKGKSAAECPSPDCVAVLRIFMTRNTQSLRIFAKNALCILELNVVSFTGLMNTFNKQPKTILHT